jgi:hypothetical protein
LIGIERVFVAAAFGRLDDYLNCILKLPVQRRQARRIGKSTSGSFFLGISSFLGEDFRAFLARPGKSDRDSLLPALHASCSSAFSRAQRALLVSVQDIFDPPAGPTCYSSP